MTLAELKIGLDSIGIPVAYREFKNNSSPPPPFVTYQMGGDSDFKADNIHYYGIDNGTIELYTTIKDPITEKRIEDKLEELRVPYSRLLETWITEESMLQVIWEFQLLE